MQQLVQTHRRTCSRVAVAHKLHAIKARHVGKPSSLPVTKASRIGVITRSLLDDPNCSRPPVDPDTALINTGELELEQLLSSFEPTD